MTKALEELLSSPLLAHTRNTLRSGGGNPSNLEADVLAPVHALCSLTARLWEMGWILTCEQWTELPEMV